jgi:hypothetical protein
VQAQFVFFGLRSDQLRRADFRYRQAGPIAQSDSLTLDRPKKKKTVDFSSLKYRDNSYHHMAEREERNTVTISVGVYIQHTGRGNKLAGP